MDPLYNLPDGQLWLGNVLEVLDALPEKSVHCVVTSIPYWGLRDYGLKATVWGEEPDLNCEHEWVQGSRPPTKNGTEGSTDPKNQPVMGNGKIEAGSFCVHCGAWFGCLGLEPYVDLYIANILEVFRKVWRVLRDDGTCWVNIGDTYNAYNGGAGPSSSWKNTARDRERPHLETGYGLRVKDLKPKDMVGIPWLVALHLRVDGWYLRSDIIWEKSNPMPESVSDRPTKSHEYIFLLTKKRRYFYDAEAIKETCSENTHSRGPEYHPTPKTGEAANGVKNNESFRKGTWGEVTSRNKRTVWTVPTQAFPGAHFATFPEDLITPCILAGTSEKGCCPECGKPWKRIIIPSGHKNKRETAHVPNNCTTKTDSTGWKPTKIATEEWKQDCNCQPRDPEPCTVLDPFGGAGTTYRVSRSLGRHSIYIDLSEKYIKMAIEHLEKVPLHFTMNTAW